MVTPGYVAVQRGGITMQVPRAELERYTRLGFAPVKTIPPPVRDAPAVVIHDGLTSPVVDPEPPADEADASPDNQAPVQAVDEQTEPDEAEAPPAKGRGKAGSGKRSGGKA